jgi:argininosuccinate lyase
MTYNRDLQEDKEPLFDAVRQIRACLQMAREVALGVELHPQVPAAAVRDSWVVATDLAEALARSGVPFRDSHHLVRELVLDSLATGKLPKDWTPESLAARDPRFTPDIARLLDPAEGMRTREILGGTGPAAVAQALTTAHARLRAMQGN